MAPWVCTVGWPSDHMRLSALDSGPGATAAFGTYKEIGPCRANDDGNSSRRHEFGWTTQTNLLILE